MQTRPLIHSSEMKPVLLALIAATLTLGSTAIAPAATNTPPPAAPVNADAAEAAYTRAIEKRAADILAVLNLKDAAKAAKVRDLLIAQYRSLRAWHDVNDSRRKGATGDELKQINASLKALHDKFISGVSAELTPEQVEKVKDKMTYGTVQVTYNAYCEIIPNLTDQDKATILEFLKAGREEAMDGGSSKEKAAIFKKYKGRINNYLNAHGHDVGKAYKDWGERQKARTAPSASNSSAPKTGE